MGVHDDNGTCGEGRIGISVITVKRSFLLVRFDVVQTWATLQEGGHCRKTQTEENSWWRLALPLPLRTSYHKTSSFGPEMENFEKS